MVNENSAHAAFVAIRYGMRQLGIPDESALREWLIANDTGGRQYVVNGYFGRELHERFVDNVSQITAEARTIERVYFAIAVGLFKDPGVRFASAQTARRQRLPQPISDAPPRRPPRTRQSAQLPTATTAGTTHRGGRPGVSRLPDGWRHIDAIDILSLEF